ncbi:MAG: hypothetical protein WCD08_07295 [Steroidobacteraceae bacterium]
MNTASYPPLARRLVVVAAAIVALLLFCQYGCVATKYKLAKKDTPAAQSLSIAFPPSLPLLPTLVSLIGYGGPGSWKRAALWDEYVVTLENRGERPLTIDSATLAGSAGTAYAAGSDPWAVEKQSKALEKQYQDRGEAFLRTAGPGVVIVGVGAATASATAGGVAFVSPAVAGAAVATIVVLPVYYATVIGINHHNKKAVMTEFKRRRLSLPLTIAPGETRTGSLFYPMVRSPGSLTLNWSNEGGSATTKLSLEFLHALHVPPAPAVPASK